MSRNNEVGDLLGSIDIGTSSVRFFIFSARTAELITYHQIEVEKIYPHEGWVEQDPEKIYQTTVTCMHKVAEKLEALNISPKLIKGIGIDNQRESTIVWNKNTGRPYYNCILWLDNRTKDIIDRILNQLPGRDINFYKHKTGLPISTYFSAFKIKWLIENVDGVKAGIKKNELIFGTVDAWILWKLTGKHYTDVSNASRTFLMDLDSISWDPQLCRILKIPMHILPEIKPTAYRFGEILDGPLKSVPITAMIGDQSSALIGQNCLKFGQTKATYGTGCFIVQNIGSGSLRFVRKGLSKEAKRSLITTIGYQLGNEPPVYALEGSIQIAGAAITWLRDNLELISDYNQVHDLAAQVPDSGGVYFVPAFQGLYAPYWDPTASGTIIGLSQFSRKAHIVRATFDSIAFQTSDILMSMRRSKSRIYVDGGMTVDDLLCQTLADINGIDVIRPALIETSAIGAAMVAGHTLDLWNLNEGDSPFTINIYLDESVEDENIIKRNEARSRSTDIFSPLINESEREERTNTWKLAVGRSMKWTKEMKEEQRNVEYWRQSVIPFGFWMLSSFALLMISKSRK